MPFALDVLVRRSPQRSGRYRRSWVAMTGWQPVTDPAALPPDAVVTLVNTQPYSRKIDVGAMTMSVPPFVVEDAVRMVMARFGNLVTAKRAMVRLPNPYILKGRFRRGVRSGARRKLRRDTMTGAEMTYPAMILEMRA